MSHQVRMTWYPFVDEQAAFHLLAESESPFRVAVVCGSGQREQISSFQSGLVHVVSLEVPATAMVEVE